ncbi:recombinase [Streptomyces pacificus]|uniref:Recombinase n=1 Tax=Streptomyces pacificus TaxID=2705029 RepID=A0A6A0AQB8_9ACTN|nr:recombinase [Streptomyces pacificus]
MGDADTLWAGLTTGSAVPTAPAALTSSPADARVGYVLLGARAVATVQTDGGRWNVPEAEVRRAAAALNAVEVDRRDLVRVGSFRPFRGAPRQECVQGPPLRWRRQITGEPRQSGAPEQTARSEGVRPCHLAGIDWRRVLVVRTRGGTEQTWWLPRAVVRLLDAAEHTEARWPRAARTRREGSAPAEPPSRHLRLPAAGGRQITGEPRHPIAPPRAYHGELQGHVYSVLSRRPGISRKVAGWMCALCRTAPASVLDHCHEHGYVRAPVCHSCNAQERPDRLYDNDIRVADHYTPLFHTRAADWLRHWHRCPGCRARTTLPLPHLAAWTARISCGPLRPTHRAPQGSRARKPCGVLRVSWTGSQNAPRSCLLTVSVDFCPSGEHRVLARIPYREAVERFGAWLAETAPAVAAAAGPDSLDGLPTRFRPVIADSDGEGQSLF